MQSSKEITIDASPDNVWRVLTNIGSWPQWQTNVSKAVIQGDVAPGTIFHWTAGGLAIRSEITDAETSKRISWKGHALGSIALHHWYLRGDSTGTTVLTEEIMMGWLPIVLSWFSPRFLDTTLNKVLHELKAEVERIAALAQF